MQGVVFEYPFLGFASSGVTILGACTTTRAANCRPGSWARQSKTVCRAVFQNNFYRVLIRFFLLFVFIFGATPAFTYRVVLDPGHGGRDLIPYSLYGDKFDRRTGVYLDRFREGARVRGVWEFEVMYDIAQKAKALLDKTTTEEGRREFKKILQKYGKITNGEIESIETFISRPAGYIESYFENRDDPNSRFRLYDYPNQKTGALEMGTISRINALTPELVITLHLTHTHAPSEGAMATVITPAYKTYKTALEYVQANKTERKRLSNNFAKSVWANWFIFDDRYKKFSSFMADAFIYFIGFWSKPNGVQTDYSRFRGYRHNLVTWQYADSDAIVESLYAQNGERYATNLISFEPKGKFWEREKAEPETWRREGGPENFGGDNHYAGMEILRFVRNAFIVNGVDTQRSAPKILKPYISTWAVPTYVNAVAPFVEIAHTVSKRDYLRMAKHRKIYAEGVAVAAYSLLYGLSTPHTKMAAKGKKIDLAKYENLASGNYFKQVTRN
ncbi:MAG: hypothetical protein LDLANPLL_01421 [Turneriella sp.]|nr:hypothetical protein [Turneriella sp.]